MAFPPSYREGGGGGDIVSGETPRRTSFNVPPRYIYISPVATRNEQVPPVNPVQRRASSLWICTESMLQTLTLHISKSARKAVHERPGRADQAQKSPLRGRRDDLGYNVVMQATDVREISRLASSCGVGDDAVGAVLERLALAGGDFSAAYVRASLRNAEADEGRRGVSRRRAESAAGWEAARACDPGPGVSDDLVAWSLWRLVAPLDLVAANVAVMVMAGWSLADADLGVRGYALRDLADTRARVRLAYSLWEAA